MRLRGQSLRVGQSVTSAEPSSRSEALWPISDLRAFLFGSWHVDRALNDRRHSISGHFRGRAQFTPVGDCLAYEECGLLDFGAHHGLAEQRFYELDLSGGQAFVSHTCEPDRYEGHFVAFDARKWQSAWSVLGPRKDEEIFSQYTRMA
jgi:hypothetical protein